MWRTHIGDVEGGWEGVCQAPVRDAMKNIHARTHACAHRRMHTGMGVLIHRTCSGELGRSRDLVACLGWGLGVVPLSGLCESLWGEAGVCA